MHCSSSLSNSLTLIIEVVKNSKPVMNMASLVHSEFVIRWIATQNQIRCCSIMLSWNSITFKNYVGSIEHAPEKMIFKQSGFRRLMLDWISIFLDANVWIVSMARLKPSRIATPINFLFFEEIRLDNNPNFGFNLNNPFFVNKNETNKRPTNIFINLFSWKVRNEIYCFFQWFSQLA